MRFELMQIQDYGSWLMSSKSELAVITIFIKCKMPSLYDTPLFYVPLRQKIDANTLQHNAFLLCFLKFSTFAKVLLKLYIYIYYITL